MRYLPDVLKLVIAEVPSNEESLIASLKDLKSSAEFAAPEMQSMWWKELGELLNDEIAEPNEQWHFNIMKILQGK